MDQARRAEPFSSIWQHCLWLAEHCAILLFVAGADEMGERLLEYRWEILSDADRYLLAMANDGGIK